MALHSFDPKIAAEVGINAAVVYQNLFFWCEHNAANETHFHDGLYWTYNSMRAFADLFPYLTSKQVRTAIEKLEKAGLVKSGNFNKSPYDRTKWYAVSHLPQRANESDHKGEPIPDSKLPDGSHSTSNNPTVVPWVEPESEMNERVRARKTEQNPKEGEAWNLDYFIERLREAYPKVPSRFKNETYLANERKIVAEAVDGMDGEGLRELFGRMETAFANPDFEKWLKDTSKAGWCPSLGNIVQSGDWERFSGGSAWL